MRWGIAVTALLFAGSALARDEVGINVHVPWTSLHLLDKVATSGASWIRVDGNWALFEGESDVADVPVEQRSPAIDYGEDQYTWEVMDTVVCKAHEVGLEVFMTLGYTPCWAPEGGGVCAPGRIPLAGKFDAFVFAAARHYADGVTCSSGTARVTHFGMWNEANLSGFWEGTVVEYRDRILVPGAAAVKAACPTCKVVGPELAHLGDTGEFNANLEAIFCDAAARDALDVVSHHSYNGFAEMGHQIWDGDSYDNAIHQRRSSLTRISLREAMEECGVTGKPVWITETGRRAATSTPGEASLDDQAQAVRLALERAGGWSYVTHTFIYEVVDDVTSDIDGFGVWRCAQDQSGHHEPCFEKPAVQAIRDVVAQHPAYSDEDDAGPTPGDDGGAAATDGGAGPPDDGGGGVVVGEDAGAPATDAGPGVSPSFDAGEPIVDENGDAGDVGEGDGGPVDDDESAGGCACGAGGEGVPLLVALFSLGSLARRPRRPRAASARRS